MYTDLDGNSRADMMVVEAMTNQATTWFNDCGDRGGDDPNTHTARGVIPAPEVELNKALIVAARWSARRSNVQYHADVGQGWEYYDADKFSDGLNFDESCEPGDRIKVYSGWLQYWGLVEHNLAKFRHGEYSWSNQKAGGYWGALGEVCIPLPQQSGAGAPKHGKLVARRQYAQRPQSSQRGLPHPPVTGLQPTP